MRDFERLAGWLGLTLLASLVAGCGAAGAKKTERLTVTGSSTVAPLVAEIGRLFETQRPGTRVDVQTGGSSRGLADARRGLADLGMVSRDPRPGEEDLHWYPVARDGLALVVHRDNPVRVLTIEQVRAIYRGEIGNWGALGGADAPVTVVHKAEGRSTLEVFLAHFGLENPEVRPDVVIGDNLQGIKTVAGNPHAIGYVSIGSAAVEAERGVPIRLLPSGGVEASVANVTAGRYPIVRTLHLVAPAEPTGAVADFLALSASARVHDLIESQAFVPIAF